MATSYPWCGFGAFKFRRSEWPIIGTDTGWNGSPKFAESTPTGAIKNDIVTLALGSDARSWEANFTPERLAALRLLINTDHVLTDPDRPAPVQRQAFLRNVTEVEHEVVGLHRACGSLASRAVRARLEFTSQ